MKKRFKEFDKNSNNTKQTLKRLDVKPRKSRGQNFLLDISVLERIVALGEPQAEENIIEIGPGLGALTKQLSQFDKLSLIEIEENFCPELKDNYPHANIINSDVRGVDFSSLGNDLVIFGNLPYVYSSEIIFHLIEHRKYISRAILLLQDEFAERMAASPGKRDYGVLSVNLQMWCDVKLGDKVPGHAFHPSTKVTSCIVRIDFLKESRFQIPPHESFRKIVQGAFSQRRKKLINSLVASGQYGRDKIKATLNECNIDGNRRAETLTLQEFANLATKLLN